MGWLLVFWISFLLIITSMEFLKKTLETCTSMEFLEKNFRDLYISSEMNDVQKL